MRVFLIHSFERQQNSYGNYEDAEVDKMFEAMNQAADPAEQRKLMRAFEQRVLDDQAHSMITLWPRSMYSLIVSSIRWSSSLSL